MELLFSIIVAAILFVVFILPIGAFASASVKCVFRCADGESCASNYTEIHHHHATDEIVNYQYASNENRR